jgi:hypothetical protein
VLKAGQEFSSISYLARGGDVIDHGKRDFWDPNKDEIHYHAMLQNGENTLEVQLARVLIVLAALIHKGRKRDRPSEATNRPTAY